MSREYLKEIGRIFDIQKFSVHDGPGIRTIVFLKGCVLRCRWCCNPESQNYEIEKMIVDGKEKIIGRDVAVEEVLEEVRQDEVYYRRSGGGITLSGGETLCQPKFGAALLRASAECGIHTAMESMACAPFEVIEKFLENLDLYLMDIKHMDGRKHKEFTGRSNELMLENAKKIASKGQKLIVRVPVVPTFNDTPEEIRAIAQYASGLPGVEEMHILPYHRLGQDKYNGLNRQYMMGDALPPSKEHMERLLEEVSKAGLKGQIGG